MPCFILKAIGRITSDPAKCKNRFGATDEIGVFEMVEAGLPKCQTRPALSR